MFTMIVTMPPLSPQHLFSVSSQPDDGLLPASSLPFSLRHCDSILSTCSVTMINTILVVMMIIRRKSCSSCCCQVMSGSVCICCWLLLSYMMLNWGKRLSCGSSNEGHPLLLDNVNISSVILHHLQEWKRFRYSLRITIHTSGEGGSGRKRMLGRKVDVVDVSTNHWSLLTQDSVSSHSLKVSESLLFSLSDQPHVVPLLLPHPHDLVHLLQHPISPGLLLTNYGSTWSHGTQMRRRPMQSSVQTMTTTVKNQILNLLLLTNKNLPGNTRSNNIRHIGGDTLSRVTSGRKCDTSCWIMLQLDVLLLQLLLGLLRGLGHLLLVQLF